MILILAVTTIRLPWLKMAVRMRITTGKGWLSFSELCPRADAFEDILVRLHRVPPRQPAG